MAKLTEKQEKFAQSIAKGMNQADAYRSSYNTTNSKNTTIWPLASNLMKNRKVAARIDELKKEIAKKSLWTREKSVQALVKAYKVADERKNSGAMTGAIKELNAMHGYNEPTKIEHSGGLLLSLTQEDILHMADEIDQKLIDV